MVSARDLSNEVAEVAEVVVAGRGAVALAAAYLVRSPSHHHFTVFISCNGLWGLVSRYNVNERNSERTLYACPLVSLMDGGGGKSTSTHDLSDGGVGGMSRWVLVARKCEMRAEGLLAVIEVSW